MFLRQAPSIISTRQQYHYTISRLEIILSPIPFFKILQALKKSWSNLWIGKSQLQAT